MSIEARVRRLQRRHEEQDELARSNGLRLLLSSADGRRFAWLFLAECGVYRNPFTANALTTAFAAGELNVGQKLLAQITETCPDEYMLMQKENIHVERSRTDSAKRAASDPDEPESNT